MKSHQRTHQARVVDLRLSGSGPDSSGLKTEVILAAPFFFDVFKQVDAFVRSVMGSAMPGAVRVYAQPEWLRANVDAFSGERAVSPDQRWAVRKPLFATLSSRQAAWPAAMTGLLCSQ